MLSRVCGQHTRGRPSQATPPRGKYPYAYRYRARFPRACFPEPRNHQADTGYRRIEEHPTSNTRQRRRRRAAEHRESALFSLLENATATAPPSPFAPPRPHPHAPFAALFSIYKKGGFLSKQAPGILETIVYSVALNCSSTRNVAPTSDHYRGDGESRPYTHARKPARHFPFPRGKKRRRLANRTPGSQRRSSAGNLPALKQNKVLRSSVALGLQPGRVGKSRCACHHLERARGLRSIA